MGTHLCSGSVVEIVETVETEDEDLVAARFGEPGSSG